MTHGGLSETRALRVIGMSASTYRYQPAPDRNHSREEIVALAQRHRRYGSGMIYLKLRQSGMIVNHKRVERLYAQENRKCAAVSERRCPLRNVSRWAGRRRPTRYGRWLLYLTGRPKAV